MIAWVWVLFVVFVLVMLALDLFVVNRKPHVINTREALAWTGVCIGLGLAFNVAVYFIYEHDWMGIGSRFGELQAASRDLHPGHEGGATMSAPGVPAEALATQTGLGRKAALQFLSGWLIEYSLSLDNIFVIALIFAHFKVPLRHQHRLLFWGILGALVLRGVMIGLGAALVHRFEWVLYIFGVILVYTAIKLVFQKNEDLDPEKGWVLRFARRVLPISPAGDEQKFFIRVDGRRMVTPLFVVLLVVETTDVVFAVDSIPAIFGITRDPFLVFTSNVFAILGLRSLYFALAALIHRFEYVKFSLAFILAFVGVKMLIEGVNIHISSGVSLGVIIGALAAGVGTSMVLSKDEPKAAAPGAGPE